LRPFEVGHQIGPAANAHLQISVIVKAFFCAVGGAYSSTVDFNNVLVGKLDQRNTGGQKERQLDYGRARGEGVGEEPNHTTARKPGPL
jgi:hypothetical protein